MFKKSMRVLTSIVMAFALLCSAITVQHDVSNAAVKVKKIILNKSRVILYEGEKTSIKVKKVTPKKASRAVTYKTNKKSVVIVSKKGVVTAKKAGDAKITVTSKSNKKLKKIVKVIVKEKEQKQEQHKDVQDNVPIQPGTQENNIPMNLSVTNVPDIPEQTAPIVEPTNNVPTKEPEEGAVSPPSLEVIPTDTPTEKPIIYEKNKSDIEALEKIIQLQLKRGAVVSNDINNTDEYIWEKGRLVGIVWNNKKLKGDLPVSEIPVLEKLWCEGNELTSLDLTDCTTLCWLYCRKNLLTELNLIGCTSLVKLECDDNVVIPTPEPKEGTVICNYDFDDGFTENREKGVFGNNCTLTLVEGMNSNYEEGGKYGNCIKVSERNGYWEAAAFAYNTASLKVGQKYTLSYDIYHENVKTEEFSTTNRACIVHTMPDYAQYGLPNTALGSEWERIVVNFTYEAAKDFIYLEFAYPEATLINGGVYKVTNKEEYYIDNFKISEYVESAKAPKWLPEPTPKTYPESYIYKQTSKEVTRWYNQGKSNNGYMHNGYNKDNFAIWMIGFYDNEYDSTNDILLNNGVYGPALDDYKGIPLTVTGEFMYEGTAQNSIYLQLNYTRPSDYPIVWKWEKGASERANEYAYELGMKGINGSENVAPNTWTNMHITFTIPMNAINGDKDEKTGENVGIYLHFANRPGGALVYDKSNIFHFRNFSIKKGVYTDLTPTPTPTSTPMPTSEETLKYNADFTVGTVVNRNKTYDKNFTHLVAQQFDVVSFENEMKGYSLIDVEASQLAVATEGEGVVKCQFGIADEMVKWAKDNGLKVRGHVLFWEQGMAKAFFCKGYDENGELVDADTLKARMKSYAEQVISHFETTFPGEVIAWDVVNEAINADSSVPDEATGLYLYDTGNFYKILGGEYIRYAFQCAQTAKRAANSNVDLIYNDFNCFQSPKTDRIVALINYLNADSNNKLIDCMGMEGYVLTYWPNVNDFKSAMERFASLGVKVGISELSIRLSPQYSADGKTVTVADKEAHSRRYEDMFDMFCNFNKDYPGVLTSVCICALFDRPDLMDEVYKPEADRHYDYGVYGTHSGLFDENYEAKEVFYRVIERLKESMYF